MLTELSSVPGVTWYNASKFDLEIVRRHVTDRSPRQGLICAQALPTVQPLDTRLDVNPHPRVSRSVPDFIATLPARRRGCAIASVTHSELRCR